MFRKKEFENVVETTLSRSLAGKNRKERDIELQCDFLDFLIMKHINIDRFILIFEHILSILLQSTR